MCDLSLMTWRNLLSHTLLLCILWDTQVWRWTIVDWRCRGSKYILLSDSPLNLLCLCRGMKWHQFPNYKQRGNEKVGEKREFTSQETGESWKWWRTSFMLPSCWFLFHHQTRHGWCLTKELRTVRKRLVVWNKSLGLFSSSSFGSFCNPTQAAVSKHSAWCSEKDGMASALPSSQAGHIHAHCMFSIPHS